MTFFFHADDERGYYDMDLFYPAVENGMAVSDAYKLAFVPLHLRSARHNWFSLLGSSGQTPPIMISRPADPGMPPRFGEYLLCLVLPRRDQDTIAGDLEEKYRKRLARFGRRPAILWYYKEVGLSTLESIRRVLLKLGLAAALEEYVRRRMGR